MPWPDKFGVFKDIADRHYSDADESGLASSAKGHQEGLAALQEALENADRAYGELLGAFEADGEQSDASLAVRARRLVFRRRGGALAAKALAGQKFMEAAAGPVKDSKSKDQDAGNKALETIHKTQFWPDWMLHRAGKETHMEQARKQLESDMSANQAARVRALDGAYKTPADGDYGFDGQPTSWADGLCSSADYSQDEKSAPLRRADYRREESSSPHQQANYQADQATSLTRQADYRHDESSPPSSQTNYQASADRSDSSPISAPSGSGHSTGGGVGDGSEGAGAHLSAGTAATALQSGEALADTHPSAPPPAITGSGGGGGGVGVPPPPGGFSAGKGADSGSIPRIGGAGGGSEAPRTGAQGGGATEKPAAQPSSSGSGPQQGAGSGKGWGAAGAGGATQAQSARQAALHDAMRGDTAGGASGAGKHIDHQNQALGTERITQLSPAALQSAHTQAARLKSSFDELPGALASAHPASASGELAQRIVHGGTIVGAGRAGFLADGCTWGRIEQPPFDHVGVTGLVFLFEDFRVEPNRDAGVFRPVVARATTTGWMGEIDPAMRLPERTLVLDRAKAPAATDHLADAGLLARGLGRWLLDDGLDGETCWRVVAVCFLAEPDAETVDGLLRLPHQVESYWPGRPGYEANVPQAVVADARAIGDDELRMRQNDPLRHAQERARLDPDGRYDPIGLPAKEAAWYREAVERARKPRLTNARWKQELDQCRKEERGGDPNW